MRGIQARSSSWGKTCGWVADLDERDPDHDDVEDQVDADEHDREPDRLLEALEEDRDQPGEQQQRERRPGG